MTIAPVDEPKPTALPSTTADMELDPARPGTAPDRATYLVLHTSTPPPLWPSHPPMFSPLIKALMLQLKPFRGMVNISHDPNLPAELPSLAFPSPTPGTKEAYPATLYLMRGQAPIRIKSLSLDAIESLDHYLREGKRASVPPDLINTTGAVL